MQVTKSPLTCLIWLVFSALLVTVSASRTWKHGDVYSGRQFDDYVTQTVVASPLVIRPALLILYEPRCESRITTEGLNSGSIPSDQYLVLAKHDYATFPENIWYELDERDDLKKRYNPVNCPEYLFFKPGTTLDQPERYDKSSRDQVRHWLWDKFKTEFTFKNSRSRPVVVEFSGNGPKVSAFTLQAGRDFIFKAYISYCMLVSDVDDKLFIYGLLIDETTAGKHIEVTDHMVMNEEPQTWYQGVRDILEKQATTYRDWRWAVAEIYLMDFKQPLLLPKFTNVGYKKGRMPGKLFNALTDFYKANGYSRQPEQNQVEPAINDREVKCGFVKFDENITNFVAEIMKPLMEDWSNTSLVLSRLYGVREYYKGNILRNHVDIVSTHVVSVILQIDKDLGGQSDWELEIIGFDGKRKNVTLDPGDMLFYESATLIHGRPFPYMGNVFANAFLHYRPQTGWTWGMSGIDDWPRRYLNGGFSEVVAEFPSLSTLNRKYKGLMKDEL